MKAVTHRFYELKSSEDGRSYIVVTRIKASVGYERAREIANQITGGEFSKYEGGFFEMENKVKTIQIFE
jgi:fumarate hydratase class II